MPKFSFISQERLNTCDEKLQQLFREVIKHYDCKIIYGHRTPEEQFELFQKGRELVGNKWKITEPNEVITHKDGFNKKSKHNYEPSRAVDVSPYPINFEDKERHYHFAGFVTATAIQLKILLRFGGDWDRNHDFHDQTFFDLLHFELI